MSEKRSTREQDPIAIYIQELKKAAGEEISWEKLHTYIQQSKRRKQQIRKIVIAFLCMTEREYRDYHKLWKKMREEMQEEVFTVLRIPIQKKEKIKINEERLDDYIDFLYEILQKELFKDFPLHFLVFRLAEIIETPKNAPYIYHRLVNKLNQENYI